MNIDSKRKRFCRTASCLNQNMVSKTRYESKNRAIFGYSHDNKRLIMYNGITQQICYS